MRDSYRVYQKIFSIFMVIICIVCLRSENIYFNDFHLSFSNVFLMAMTFLGARKTCELIFSKNNP